VPAGDFAYGWRVQITEFRTAVTGGEIRKKKARRNLNGRRLRLKTWRKLVKQIFLGENHVKRKHGKVKEAGVVHIPGSKR